MPVPAPIIEQPPPALVAADGGDTGDRRRFGIMAKMALAFTMVAALAVVSEGVAWLSFRGIEHDLTDIVHRAVPEMTTAETLAIEATTIAGATGALTTALTEHERADLMAHLETRVAGLNRRLDQLIQLNVSGIHLAALRARIRDLDTNLIRQSDLVAERIAIATQIRNYADHLAESHKQFLAAVTPRIDSTYRALLSGIKTLVDDLGPAHPASSGPEDSAPSDTRTDLQRDMRVLQSRIGRLFNYSVGEMLALVELAATGNLAAGLLNEAVLVTKPAQVQQLRFRFSEVTASMGNMRLRLTITHENQVLIGMITPMLQYGLGADNLFDLRLRQLGLIEASDEVVAENRRLSEALTEAVNTLLANARTETEMAAASVLANAAYARFAETLAAALTVLISALIGWRYVGPSIIGRILALRQAMDAEAAGREIIIPAEGNDEITDMAAALHHFVERRKRAESDLRAAKERAEGAFAELKELQETLVQTEKMAALGGLVAGVAHELNTPVGVCLTAASLLSERTELLARAFDEGHLRKSVMQEYIGLAGEISTLIRGNLDRAGDLIRVFKQVAVNPCDGELQVFRVREHIEMALTLVGEHLRTNHHAVIIECPPTLAMHSYPDALRQVIAILVDNALTHAFPAGTIGTIALSAALTSPDTVTITVSDDGIGIKPENLPRIFDPFFTTRRSQGDVGLGLHMAFNIVTSALGGRILAESQPANGCHFVVTLPVSPPSVPSRPHI